MLSPYLAARTAHIRRGLPIQTLRELRVVRLNALGQLSKPGADPRSIQTDAIEAAKAIIRREALTAAVTQGETHEQPLRLHAPCADA